MWSIAYVVIFCFSAVIYLLLQSSRDKEIPFLINESKKIPTSIMVGLKAVQAILATVFIIFFKSSDSIFIWTFIIAFILCAAGDVGIESSIELGLILFLISQLLFTITFFGFGMSMNPTMEAFLITGGIILLMVCYIGLILRFLQSSENGLGNMKIPVLIYCIVISLMLSSSIFLLLTSNTLEVAILVLGALLFVISDSLIAIREFHHKMPYSVVVIDGSYFLALLLMSLTILVLPNCI